MCSVAATGSPITFFGTGEHIDDLEPFNAQSFVSRLLGMGDIQGLANLFNERKDEIEAKGKQLAAKLERGEVFSFRDMAEQFRMLLKLGPLSQIMGMIPGMSQMMSQLQQQSGSSKPIDPAVQIKQFLIVLDSMSAVELDSDERILLKEPKRIERIARGSGTSRPFVETVIRLYQPFKGMASMMQQMGLIDQDLDPKKLQGKQGQQMLGKLTSMLPPQMRNMFGQGNLENMMRQFASMGGSGGPLSGASGAGGMPDLGSLMANMPPGLANMFGGGGGGGMPPGLANMFGGGGPRAGARPSRPQQQPPSSFGGDVD